jgi:alpha-ketoglutarate-dependent 2,4-dichlorophenoxyacetate dioxygenase
MSMPMRIRELHPLFGAELQGLAIEGAVSAEERAAILENVHKYGIVLFRGQTPTEAQMGQFAKSLGPIWTISSSMLKDFPNINEATSVVYHYTNRGADGKPLPSTDKAMLPLRVNEMWHTDSTYSRPGASMFRLKAATPSFATRAWPLNR